MSVIKHEFGKKERQTVRRFRSLLALDAMHEANVRSNPVPYLERASERIYSLRRLCSKLLRPRGASILTAAHARNGSRERGGISTPAELPSNYRKLAH